MWACGEMANATRLERVSRKGLSVRVRPSPPEF